MRKGPVYLGVAIAVLAALGGLITGMKPKKTKRPQPAKQLGPNSNMITYDGNGFEPYLLAVAPGTVVTIKNASSQALELASDPHPMHTDDTDLNAGTVEPGHSKTFTVTKKGTYGYHNHLDPTQEGTITVQ